MFFYTTQATLSSFTDGKERMLMHVDARALAEATSLLSQVLSEHGLRVKPKDVPPFWSSAEASIIPYFGTHDAMFRPAPNASFIWCFQLIYTQLFGCSCHSKAGWHFTVWWTASARTLLLLALFGPGDFQLELVHVSKSHKKYVWVVVSTSCLSLLRILTVGLLVEDPRTDQEGARCLEAVFGGVGREQPWIAVAL